MKRKNMALIQGLSDGLEKEKNCDWAGAEFVYRQVIQSDPECIDAWFRLGLISLKQAKYAESIRYLQRAIELNPNLAEAWSNLGIALASSGNTESSIAVFQRAVQLNPGRADLLRNLGAALRESGRLDQAIQALQSSLLIDSNHVASLYSLTMLILEQNRPDEAMIYLRQIVSIAPDNVLALVLMSELLYKSGNPLEAMQGFNRAIAIAPNFERAHLVLGNVLYNLGNFAEAADCNRRVLELNPLNAEAYHNLGTCLSCIGKFSEGEGRLDQAIECYQRALELKPDLAVAHNSLGNAFKEQGKMLAAIACYRRALELMPEWAGLHSNLAYMINFCPGYDAKAILEENLKWSKQFADPMAKFIRPHLQDRSPNRRLRIGYVSPDFRTHCQAMFSLPLLSSHNHHDFEIFCYSDVTYPDGVTQRLRAYSDHWRDISGLSTQRTVELVRQDQIDILVDMTMHMSRNQLPLFACKPAPVQVCWLAYPGTTGLSTMDYRLTDQYLDPPHIVDAFYSEQSVRLPDTFWCYDPLANGPPIPPLPALANGYITFGCLNNFCKVNPLVLKLWAQVLLAVNHSRITILSPEGSHRQDTITTLENEGVACNRISFVGYQPRPRYLEYYQKLDIGLDTFPYNGHTTSLDSFWMGVPVITLVGQTVVGRAGLSQLSNLGIPELISHSPEDYVRIAQQLAGDLSHLRRLRETLRDRMQASPLMDAPRFARNIENAYRWMWQQWCSKM
jgi:protein O-GlcNAc transferase